MHPNRRRKKRPNYGIRTVEILRGPNGFGFTISGQQPCILSCIVSNSPAERAGLRAGDFLISVNGVSVSKIAHDAVVNLIGNSSSVGPIEMTVAEHYYSDTSSSDDEDLDMSRTVNVVRKPKYTHKGRSVQHRRHSEVVKRNFGDDVCEQAGPIEYKALVGYLGTIEMPKRLQVNTRLQTVCSCIRKLRQEKRAPTDVLMTVLPTCLTLKNSSNHILAIYPTNRVVYVSVNKDSRYFGLVTSAFCEIRNGEQDSQEADISNSCHVFVTDSKLVDHNLHLKKAETFKITCTPDIVTGYCLEFPENALSIVSLIQTMYRLKDAKDTPEEGNGQPVMANSPQPSASSNSDSGIGFRDDSGNISDRILVVEFPANRPLPLVLPNNQRPVAIDASKVPLESLNNDTLNNVRCRTNATNSCERRVILDNIRAYETVSIKNAFEKKDQSDYLAKQNNFPDGFKRLTVRAMPDPSTKIQNKQPEQQTQFYSERAVDVPSESFSLHSYLSDYKGSVDNISLHSSKSVEITDQKSVFKTPKCIEVRKPKRRTKVNSSCDDLATSKSVEDFKLSPKVYGVSKSNCSCEELNNIDDKCGYGSLQELNWSGKYQRRNFTASEPDVRFQAGKHGFMCEKNGEVKCANGTDGPAGWAASFEKLLDDPLGLQTFAEFLKKEFSAENIYFWTACERYKRLPSGPERAAEAQRIYRQHLCVGAPEPVNVDSQGRQCTEQSLEDADSCLFDQAQKQIFNLMKFDSYPRFLKSDLYRQCVTGNIVSGSHWDSSLFVQPSALPTPNKLKKSLSNAEDRRRKSLLPWHRKNRSKSKDRGETDYKKSEDGFEEDETPHEKRNDVYSSKSSLTSLDLAMCSSMQESIKGSQDELFPPRNPLCRVILNNELTTIVQIKHSETIQQFISRLLEKRGLNYSAFEVCSDKHPKALNVNEPSIKLAGCEVTVEQRVVFKLDFPNRKSIAVKSKYKKNVVDVMRPILHKYNYSLEQVMITTKENQPIDVYLPVTSIDGMRLNVQLLEDLNLQPEPTASSTNSQRNLEEITNKVFKDIIQEKSEASKQKSDKGSVKSEDWGSEHSSGIFGRFLRRDSAMHERKKKGIVARKEDGGSDQSSACKKPLIAKLKAGVKLQVACSESDELYEGLSRALRSRLEDQRGTEINFEMPDFLKDKEKEQNKQANRKTEETQPTSPVKTLLLNYENVIINNNGNCSQKPTVSPNKSIQSEENLSSSSNQSSPSKSSSLEETVIENRRNCGEPPPLPPKPKVLPAKPLNWGQSQGYFKVPNQGKRTLFLEPSTSSFV